MKQLNLNSIVHRASGIKSRTTCLAPRASRLKNGASRLMHQLSTLRALTLLLVLCLSIGNVWGADTELGSGYTKIKSISSLAAGDEVVLYCDNSSSGVTGYSGSDATVSTSASNWIKFAVEKDGNNYYFKDPTSKKYVTKQTSNKFTISATTASGNECSVNSDGVLCINSRYLVKNNSYYRMYGSVGSYKGVFVYKVDGAQTTVTLTAETNGSVKAYSDAERQTELKVDANNQFKVNQNSTVYFTATPLTGFEVDTWNGATVDAQDKTKASLAVGTDATKTVSVSFAASSTPSISSNPTSKSFGSINQYAEASAQEFTITGANLTEAITATLSNDQFEFVGTPSLTATGGTVSVKPKTNASGDLSANLHLASGETNIDVALTATIVPVYVITWKANGQKFDTTHVVSGSKLVLPTSTPDPKDYCDGKKFMGWYGNTYSNPSIAPDYAKAGDEVTRDTTYYAVFAISTTSGEGGSYEFTYDSHAGWTISSNAVDKSTYYLLQKTDYIESPSITDLSSVTSIVVGAGKFNNKGAYKVMAGSTQVGTASVPSGTSSSSKTFNNLSLTGSGTIQVVNTDGANSGASSSQAGTRLYTITVNYGPVTTYSDFSTTCTPTAKTPTLTTATAFTTSTFEVTITNNEEGATVYYTTNGVDPSTSSSSFTGASKVIEISETTTVKAMAVITDKDPSAIASATYTKVVPLTTIKATQDAATTEEQTVYITFNDWVVTGVIGDVVYISDGTAYGIALDQASSGFVAGNKLNGTVPAQLVKTDGEDYPYAKLSGITSTTTGLTVTTGGSVTPLVRTISQLSGATQGVVITLNGVLYEEEDGYKYLSESDQSYIQYYNDFAVVDLNDKFTDGNYYNVTGMFNIYDDGRFIAPRSLADVEEVLATPTNLAVSNITASGMTITWDAVTSATSYDVIVNGGDPISVSTNSKELSDLSACNEYTIQVIAKATGYVASQAAQIVENTISDKTITINLTNTLEDEDNAYKAANNPTTLPCTAAEISLTYSVTDDYDLPETITVTIGGETATAGTDYTWSSATGIVTIPAAKQTGSIVITINSPETSKTYYRLNFDNNGGSGEMDEIKRVSTATEAERTIVLPACTFTPPTGKEFNFWSLSTSSPSEVTQVVLNQENTVVYAIWKDITYTLESISVKTNPKTAYQDGEALDLTGMVLSASYSASYGAGKTEDVTEGYTSEPANGTTLHENTNVVITYQQKTCTLAVTVSPTYSITYNVTLGNVASGAPTTVAEGGTFTYPAVENVTCEAGYTFAGWTTDKDFLGGASAPSDLKAAGATSATVSANVVLYAVYNKSKTTATTFSEFAADSKMTSAPFVIAAKTGESTYIALPNSGYATTSSGGGTIAGNSISVTSTTDLNNNKMTFIKNGSSYNVKYNDTYYLTRKASSDTGLKGVTSAANWNVSAGQHGTYRMILGTEARCIAYRTGTTNKFGYYGTNNVTAQSTEYYDLELIPVPVTKADYSLNPECKAERALELVSSEGTEIRLIEGETVDSKTTIITAKDGTGSEGAITLSYSGSESAYVSIDGANVTFTKDGSYLIDANQAATQAYAATSAKITITVNKAFVTLTYDGNGATEGVPAAVTEIVKGTEVTLNDGKSMVYGQNAFDKWGTEQTGGTTYAAGASVTMNKSMTLYAQWILAYSVNIPEFAHGSISSSPAYAKAGVEVALTITPEDGYVLRPNSLKVLKENGEKVYCSESTGKFDMPASNVTISAEFVKGALYKQRRVNQQSIVCDQTGEYPEGATATFASTYAGTSNNITQLTADNNMTYTIKGYAGKMIKSITLSMKSNSGSGAGTMYVKVGTNKIAEIADATTFNQWFDNTAYQTDFVDVHVTMPKAIVAADDDIVIYIACTTKSLYCESVFIEWADVTYTRNVTNQIGTICLAQGVEAGNYMGATFYEGDYVLMDGANPYKYYLSEVDHLEAGYPYVFVKNDNASAIYLAETGESNTAQSKNGLVGTLSGITTWESDGTNALTGNYMVVGNLFCECGVWCGLNANRAYLNLADAPKEYTEQPAPVGKRRLTLTNQAHGTPTAIDNLTEEGIGETNIGEPNKVIINGQFFIIRGEKTYDAQGKLVK